MKFSTRKIPFPRVMAGTLGALVALTACNGAPGTAAAGDAPGGGSGDSRSAGASGGAVGESCSGAGKTCLGMHFVAYKSSSGSPVATPEQVATIIRTTNQIFAQCNVGFQVESYEAVDPASKGLAFGEASQNQLNQIRDAFNDANDRLLAVTTGPWNTAVNAWTNMPGESLHGAIMESGIVSYGSGVIYAHEFGHYLGLDHASDASNLMNPVIHTSSTALTPDQCQQARDVSVKYWSAMLRS